MAAARKREPDPPTQLRALGSELERNGPARGYALRGDEAYFVERGIELVQRSAQARGLELARHDQKDPEFALARLLDDLAAAPLFASARCVVVRNADALVKKSGKDDAPFVRAAASFLGRKSGVLVVSGGAGALRADGALCKAIVEAGGALLNCRKLWDSPPPWDPDPRRSELVQWLVARAKEQKLRLSAEDAVYLAAASGNDLAALDTQLEKLRHGGGRSVRELVGWDSGGTPWKAADELVSGELPRALASVEALYRAGFHSDRDGRREVDPAALSAILLASLRSKVRQLLAGARAVERGASMTAAANEAGVTKNERALAEFQRLVPTRSASAWRDAYEDVAALDRGTRRGKTLDAADFAQLALRWRRK